MAINYSKVARQTPVGSDTYKVFAQAQTTAIWDLNTFAGHIHDHNSTLSKGLILHILTDMVSCMKEKLLDGTKIKLDDFGSFWISLQSNGQESADNFTASDITGIRVRYTVGSDMTSAKLMKDASFEFVGTREQQAEIKAQRNADLNALTGGESSSESGSGNDNQDQGDD
ncbi:MAG: hypothetical protein LUC86_00025 [Prevotellaceae bacterium]|nr:hypothetical protein [Prevotellaceae bacterium]